MGLLLGRASRIAGRVMAVLVLSGPQLPPLSAQEAAPVAPERAEIIRRVTHDITLLASEDFEGRGVETKGIELAAQHILNEYEVAGVKPGMPDGGWRQAFQVAIGDTVISDKTAVTLQGPGGAELKLQLGEQFQPIRRGKNGAATGGVAFVGYGISSAEDKYDEYAGIDVQGKVVVVIRREPQNRPDGAFRGQETSPNAYIDRKLELIRNSGAAGVLFVNDMPAEGDQDELADPSSFGNDESAVPFAHVKRAVVDELLKAVPLQGADGQKFSSLKDVCAAIDQNLKPLSQDLQGWTATVSTVFEANSVTAYNLIGVVEGEGPLADETIVIGGHYDHLGFGGYGSRAATRTGEVHNGADDNASGTAAVMELARRFAAGPKPKRRLVFICFSGEERGLLGSAHYVREPVFPLEKTVAMLNFDMIGNLRNNNVEVGGVGTAAEFAEVVKRADEAISVDVTAVESAFAGSDHLPFYQSQIPVMFCFTGMTEIYHTPDDDSKTLNMEGAVLVIDYSEQLLRGMSDLPARPAFAASQPGRRRAGPRTPYLGLQPDLAASGVDGIVVRTVRPESPAAAAGLQTGDVILQVADKPVEGYQTLIEVLGAAKAGDKLKLSVKRGEVMMDVEATLGEPRR